MMSKVRVKEDWVVNDRNARKYRARNESICCCTHHQPMVMDRTWIQSQSSSEREIGKYITGQGEESGSKTSAGGAGDTR